MTKVEDIDIIKSQQGSATTFTHMLLVGIQNSVAILTNNLTVSQTVQNKFTIRPSNSTMSYLPERNDNIYSYKDICKYL